jgi:recombination protein RecA
MQTDKLQDAISSIHVRFGDQALVRATRMPAAEPWPTGLPLVDRLCGIGGLPRGRISVFQGPPGSGKLSLALALLARATHEFARPIVLDAAWGHFDPWTLAPFGGNVDVLTVVQPPTREAAGEAATALARGGAGFLLVRETLPERSLATLEAAAARSGSLVLVVAEEAIQSEALKALGFASSLTLRVVPAGDWIEKLGLVVGMRARVTCLKNKLAVPGAEAEVEVRYPLGARLFPPGTPVREREEEEHVVKLWPGQSAAV